jgi:hypothetical protein
MAEFTKPLPPQVKIANEDGTPTREFHQWLSGLYSAATTPGTGSDFQPTSAKLTAAGAVGRIVASMTVKESKPPLVFVLGDNPDALKVGFTGADLKTTLDPAGTVGTHHVGVRATDARGRAYSGTLLVELT